MALTVMSENALPPDDPEKPRDVEKADMPAEDLKRALNRIREYTLAMRILALCAVSTVVGGIVCLGLVFFSLESKIFSTLLAQDAVYWSIAACVTGILLVVSFEAKRRRGEVYFEEVSNELQWGIA